MRVTGLMFVGARTDARAEMTAFVRTVLGLAPAHVSGLDADLFELPDGSSFAVAEVEDAPGERTVGFSVDDLEAATDECAQLVSTSTTRSPPTSASGTCTSGLPDGTALRAGRDQRRLTGPPTAAHRR